MANDPNEVRRRIAFDTETYLALDRLAKDRMASLQELADEAFRDLPKKHRRPVTLKDMLRESVRQQPANDSASAQASAVLRTTLDARRDGTFRPLRR
jgi:hypothetical protein